MSRNTAAYPDPTLDTSGAPSVAVEDFAFADTVVAAGDLEDAVPPSGILVSDETGQAMVMPPLQYVPEESAFGPSPYGDASLWTRMRHGVRATREEMQQLWSATACLEEIHDGNGAIVYQADPFVRAATVGRRVRTLFSFFEWDRADVLRAAWIGLAVFVLAATVGAVVLQMGPPADPAQRFDRTSTR